MNTTILTLVLIQILVTSVWALRLYGLRKVFWPRLMQCLQDQSAETAQLKIQVSKLVSDAETDAKIAARRKALENPSTELKDFLSDVIESGCGIIKIHPDTVMIRGMKR